MFLAKDGPHTATVVRLTLSVMLDTRLRQPGIDLFDQFCGGPPSGRERSGFVSKKKKVFFRVCVCACVRRIFAGEFPNRSASLDFCASGFVPPSAAFCPRLWVKMKQNIRRKCALFQCEIVTKVPEGTKQRIMIH